ncbi:DUF3052 domain-containing protein [Streptomyces sp. NPDC057287]|uniref:DUF3052 domain-containing protein n=1 Tax=Streptomyces sp. NPDC057287 TaxID=3346086 RepID=UPI00362E60BC
MTTTDEQANPAVRLGIQRGQVVQEIGYDDDVDQELRAGIGKITGNDLVDEDHDDLADVVVLWFREDDGDLTDALVDNLMSLQEGGVLWLLTPKSGRDGYVNPSSIGEAARSAGLALTTSVDAASHWAGSRLVSPKAR